jgi:ABC-2 type transport system ATP-binding protein
MSSSKGRASEFALETDSLTKTYHGIKAVEGLSLQVPYGSIYGFLGPNGAGKTTTIKMLMGLTKPDQGLIRICGKMMQFGHGFQRHHVGFLPDVPNFYDWMTAKEFLLLSAHLLSVSVGIAKKRIPTLLTLVGLEGVKKRIGSFSRGMKQRLGIAQALVNDPKVIFLDEPSSALDPIGRKEIMNIVSSLAGKTTVFFSTHILSDIERVCNRVVILHKGHKMLEESITALKEKFPSRTIQLELTQKEHIPSFFSDADSMSWIEKVEEKDGRLSLLVNDPDFAQHEIVSYLYEKGWGLRKWWIQEPTLEDIFMHVVKDS